MWVVLALIAIIILGIAEIFVVENERFGWATICLVAAVVLAQGFHVISIVEYATSHLVLSLVYMLAYLAIGVLWSFVKWFSFLMLFRDKFRELKDAFLRSVAGREPVMEINLTAPIPETLREDFQKFAQREINYSNRPFGGLSFMKKPRAVEHKARIVSWMSFWPFSVVGTFLNDPIRRLFNWLFNSFKALYQKMADKLFDKDVELR